MQDTRKKSRNSRANGFARHEKSVLEDSCKAKEKKRTHDVGAMTHSACRSRYSVCRSCFFFVEIHVGWLRLVGSMK